MDFTADTLRLTPLDTRRHLIDRGPVVLSDLTIAISTGHQTRREVVERWGIVLPDGQPEEWETVEVMLSHIDTSTSGGRGDVSDVVNAVSRTSQIALEAWRANGEGVWDYLVMPSVSFETLGAGGVARRGRFEFSGDLFHELWGLAAEEWYEPRESNGKRQPFLPLVAPAPGALWSMAVTDAPPPAATSRADRLAIVEADPFRRAGS